MADIIITRVRNGWVVRLWEPYNCPGAVRDQSDCSVYTDIEEMQEALPFLLKFPPGPSGPVGCPNHSIDTNEKV